MGRARVALLSVVAIAIVLAGVGAVAAFDARVYPGVRAAGVDLGGLDGAEATARLADAARAFAVAPVTVVEGDRRWTATNAEVGVELDTDRALADALSAGKSGDAPARLGALVLAALRPNDLGWPRRQEGDALDDFIDGIARDIDRDPVNADVLITTGGVELREPRDGLRVDREQLRAAILGSRVIAPRIPVLIAAIAPGLDADAVADARSGATAAYRPTRLAAGSETILIPAERIAGLLRVERLETDEGERLIVSADARAVGDLVDDAAAQLDGTVRDAVLVPGDDRLVVLPGRDGVLVDRAAAAVVIADAIFTPTEGERLIALPAAVVPPTFPTDEAARISEETRLTGAFTTYFPENWARATNIGNAARTFDGLLIAPGESFSFWDRIGEVSPRTGYVYAGTIIGGISAQAIGGGLCQVSTTLFNAVARTGARIDERHEHSYYIERYPLGLDAAVFAPSLDLRWTNDTGVPLYLFGRGTETSVSFWLYGAPTGRVVVFTDPVQANLRWPSPAQPADPAHAPGYVVPGRDVWVTRIVSSGGVELSRDIWYSHYAPVWGGPTR